MNQSKPPRKRDKLERFRVRASQSLGSSFVNGLRICGALFLLIYVYKVLASQVQGVLAGPMKSVCNLIGIPASVITSGPVCIVLVVLFFVLIGQIFRSTWGHKVVSKIEELACKIPIYKAIRRLVQFPTRSAPAVGDPALPEMEKSSVVWFYSGGGYIVSPVKARSVNPDGTKMLCLWIPSVPMPTGWCVRWVEESLTSPAGLNWGAWTLWQATGGGELPAGAIPAPSRPPKYCECGASGPVIATT